MANNTKPSRINSCIFKKVDTYCPLASEMENVFPKSRRKVFTKNSKSIMLIK